MAHYLNEDHRHFMESHSIKAGQVQQPRARHVAVRTGKAVGGIPLATVSTGI